MRTKPYLFALHFGLVLALQVGHLDAATVTNLQVSHRKGQSFITFRELTSSGTTYNVYRSRSRITSTSGLASIATLPQGSGTYLHTGERFVITDAGTPLAAQTGLLVWTTDESGSYYYAVTNSQDSSISLGVNSLDTPVAEARVPVPGAVLMEPRGTTFEGYPLFQYFAWEDYASWDPSTGYYGNRFDVALERYPLDATKTYPLHVRLHSANPDGYREPDRYMGSGARGIWLFPVDLAFQFVADPYTGEGRFFSGWFGYSTSGVAYNVTERRVKRYVELVVRDSQFRVDPARIYVSGASMGGGGSLHMAYHYPKLFAAAAASIGWVDPYAWATGNWEWIIGSRSAITPVNSLTGPNWWNWQDMSWLVNSGPAFLPPVVHTFRKDDGTIDESHYDELLQNTEQRKFPMIAQWKNGGHLTFWVDGPAELYRFRSDEAHPAIGASTNSIAFSAQEGQRNFQIDWSSSLHDLFTASTADAIVDTENQFKMTFKSLGGSNATAQVTIRNAQRFLLDPGTQVSWENRNFSTMQVIASGTTVADSNGLVTVSIGILTTGNQLVLNCASCRTDAGLKEIRQFYLSDLSPIVVGQINEIEKCVVARVPANTDLRHIRPTIKFAGASITPPSGQDVDFSSPVAYVVEAEDGTLATYTVNVTASGNADCSDPAPPPDTVPPAPPSNLRVLR